MALRTTNKIDSDTLLFRKNYFKACQLIGTIQSTRLDKQAIDIIDKSLRKAYTIDFILSNISATNNQKSLALDRAAEMGYLSPINDNYWFKFYSIQNY